MATETLYCGTAAVTTSAPFDASNVTWADPTNAQGDTTSTAAQASGAGAWLSDGLKCTNFGFTDVSGTINSILAEIESLESDAGSTFLHLRIVKADGSIGTDTTNDGLAVPNSKSFASATASLWGLTWTADDIKDADFGVVFDVDNPNGFPPGINTEVYRVKITVDYTAAAAGGGGGQRVSQTGSCYA